VLVGSFVVAQRFGVINLLDRAISMVVGHWTAEARPPVGELHDTVWRVYRRGTRLAGGFVLHVVCWVVGAGEVWLALKFLGHDVSWETALIIESLGQAIRSAAFVVPGALGVQEGGYVLLGAVFGIDPQISLALSLTKRVRDIVIGAPALLAWQVVEGQRLLGGLRVREGAGEAD
jgi:putative membrane protein